MKNTEKYLEMLGRSSNEEIINGKIKTKKIKNESLFISSIAISKYSES